MMISTFTVREKDTANQQNQKASDFCMWRCRFTLQIPKREFQL